MIFIYPQETLNVHTLDLADNNLGPEGAKYLAELISENNFLKHLVRYLTTSGKPDQFLISP